MFCSEKGGGNNDVIQTSALHITPETQEGGWP